METKEVEQENRMGIFSEIVKKAYEIGTSDKDVTLQMLMDELKSDLVKITG